jgi:hypothetical protein
MPLSFKASIPAACARSTQPARRGALADGLTRDRSWEHMRVDFEVAR